MWKVWERREMRAWWENLRGRNHLEDLVVEVKIV
jgi:hypothetical protein